MNREQQRARHAFAVVAPDSHRTAEFESQARGLPEMLQRNGLLASWAFLLSQERNNASQQVLTALHSYLRQPASEGETPDKALLSWIGGNGQGALSGRDLQKVTAEAIAYAAWLKRASEATKAKASSAGKDAGPGAPQGKGEGSS